MPAELVRNRKPRPRIYTAILAAGDALWRRPSAAQTASLAAHGLRAPLPAWSCAPARPYALAPLLLLAATAAGWSRADVAQRRTAVERLRPCCRRVAARSCRWSCIVTAWYQCWLSELSSRPRRTPLHTLMGRSRTCSSVAQCAAAELELSCDPCITQPEAAAHSARYHAASRSCRIRGDS